MTKVTVGGGSSVHLRGTIKPGLEDVIEGTNVTIDKTDPKNPIISSTGGGSSLTLIDGNGTTVNGTGDGVDLGGTVNNDIALTPDSDETRSLYIGTVANNVALATIWGTFKVLGKDTGGFTSVYLGVSPYRIYSFSAATVDAIDLNSNNASQLYLQPNGNWALSGGGRSLGYNGIGFQINLGSDATGDTYYRNSSGYFTRLPVGTNGDVLTLASGLPSWAAPSGGGGAWSLASGGTATGTNTFAMGSNPFILTSGVTTGTGATAGIQNVFNSLTTGNGLDISSSSVSSGSIVKITGTGTAAASNTQSGLVVYVSGANTTSTQTTYGGYFSNTKTGTSSTNIAGYFNASGGTNNLAIYAPSGIVTLGSTGAGYNGRIYSTAGTGGRVALFGNLEITTSAGPSWSGTGIQAVGSNRKISFYGGNWGTDNDQVDVSWNATSVNRSGVDLGIFRSSLGGFNTAIFQANSIAAFRFIDTWPTLTTPLNVVYGFDYNPSSIGNGLTHIAWRNTSGGLLFGGTTITANTRLDIRGTGTTTNLIQRWADSGNTPRLAIQDNGVILVGTDAGTAGQVLTSQGSGSAPIWTAAGSGSIARSINSVSGTTSAGAAASTDYVYNCTSTFTLTLPTAVGNTNRYTIKNSGTGTITVNTTSSQTIDGSLTAVMSTQYSSIDVISNGTNWLLI